MTHSANSRQPANCATPRTLDAQVDRLLNDPRTDAFVRPFVTQWLEMGQPITVAMDHIQKQDFRFGRHLKASMREGTVHVAASRHGKPPRRRHPGLCRRWR